MDKKKMVNADLVLQATFGFCFLISSFVVAKTANEGFNVVLTGLLYMAYVAGGLRVVNKTPTPLAMGFLIGVSFMFTCISLMTAIFWGELAKCDDKYSDVVDQYTCDHQSAMKAVCAFAVFMFLLQGVITGMLGMWRNELMEEAATAYDDMGATGGAAGNEPATNQPYAAYDDKRQSYDQTSTADL